MDKGEQPQPVDFVSVVETTGGILLINPEALRLAQSLWAAGHIPEGNNVIHTALRNRRATMMTNVQENAQVERI